MSDTHLLWAEIEAAAPPPRKKRPESTPREKTLRQTPLDTKAVVKEVAPSESRRSSRSSSKQATGQSPSKQPLSSPTKQPLASGKREGDKAKVSSRAASPSKAKTHRPRSGSPTKAKTHRQAGSLPHDAMGRIVQPAWNTTGPPRRAPGEVVNRFNHQGFMHAEAAEGWKPDPSLGGGSAVSMATARSDRSEGAFSTITTARQSRVTTSPSTRGHPNQERRNELRKGDMLTNINYYATSRLDAVRPGSTGPMTCSLGDPVYVAPDNDRKMKEASWISSQAWFESLRYYPKGEEAIENQDCEATFSGNTHGASVPTEHIQTDVRNRVGIAAADPDWMPSQLPEPWAPEMEARLRSLKVNKSPVRAHSPVPLA